MIEFLRDAYDVANQVRERPGARTMLSKTYGREWANFDKDDLKNMSMAQLTKMYNEAKSAMDPRKANADNMWASDFITNKADRMAQIDLARQQAVATYKHEQTLNRKAVKQIMDSKSESVDRDADLLLTSGGNGKVKDFLTSKEEFEKRFIQRHQLDDVYQPKRHQNVGKIGSTYIASDRDIKADATNAWENLQAKFYDKYSNLPNSSLTGRGELGGFGGFTTANPVQVSGLDAKEPGNKYNIAVKDAIDNIVSKVPDGEWSVTFGDPTVDNLAASKPELKEFVKQIRSDIASYDKSDSRGKFDVVYSDIAANNSDYSALTIKMTNPAYIKKFVGSESNPGPLYDYISDIQAGKPISIIYKNKSTSNAFRSSAETKPLDFIINSTGLDYDQFTKGGKLRTTMDGDEYLVSGFYYMYKQGELDKLPFTRRYPRNTTNYENVDRELNSFLLELHKQNALNERKLASMNKGALRK
jgi:hypothetical protein